MKLESKLKRLVSRLPAQQQTLDFARDNLWQELSRADQQTCCQAIGSLLLQILWEEPHNKSNNNTEDDDHE